MIDAIAERLSQGASLGDADARALLESHDLIAIGSMADDLRRRMHGARTTFLRVLEVHAEAVPASLPPSAAAGELRIMGRPASLDAAVASARAAAAIAGGIPLSGFSLADLAALAGSHGQALEEAARALRGAGLESVAEAPVGMEGAAEAVLAARRGGLAVTRMVVVDLPEAPRVEVLARARDLQAAAGGFRSFAPLPRTISVARPSTGYDDVKQVAVARLVVANVESIQVDWSLYGPKLAQVALTVGADDVDGIAAVETGTLGTRRSAIEEIRGNIRAAALEAIERNGRWEVIGA